MSAKMQQDRPVPQGEYVVARRHGALIWTSGMTPRKDGVLLFTGPVRSDADFETYRDAVTLASSNALSAARSLLTGEETIASVLSLTVYIAADQDFTAHSRIADFASQFFRAELGAQGVGSRAAIGVATLPGNAPVEIQIVAAVF